MSYVEVKYELDLDEPDQDVLKYAREHINEHPDSREVHITELRTRILENGGEVADRVDDLFLLRFLRAQNFDVEKAYQLLINYYRFKKQHPEYYNEVNFERMLAIADSNIISTVPFTDGSGRRILIYRMGKWVPEEITTTELFQATLLSLDMGILEQKSQILGGIAIVDVAGIKLKHLAFMTPSIASQMVEIALVYGGIHPDYSYEPWLQYADTNDIVLNELKRLGYTLEDQARQKLGVIRNSTVVPLDDGSAKNQIDRCPIIIRDLV